jgi:hypothetical protein
VAVGTVPTTVGAEPVQVANEGIGVGPHCGHGRLQGGHFASAVSVQLAKVAQHGGDLPRLFGYVRAPADGDLVQVTDEGVGVGAHGGDLGVAVAAHLMQVTDEGLGVGAHGGHVAGQSGDVTPSLGVCFAEVAELRGHITGQAGDLFAPCGVGPLQFLNEAH